MKKEQAELPRPHITDLGFVRGDMRVHCPGHYFYCYAKQVGEYPIELDHDFCEGVLHLHVDGKPILKMPEARIDDAQYIAVLLGDLSDYVGRWMTRAALKQRNEQYEKTMALFKPKPPAKRSLLERLFA